MIAVTTVTVVAWINVVGAGVSFVLQCCAARHGALRARWLHAAIAAVAAVYVVAYAWLVEITVSGDSSEQWSEVMRGVGPVAWVVAWWAPAILSLVRFRQDRRAIEVAKKVIRKD